MEKSISILFLILLLFGCNSITFERNKENKLCAEETKGIIQISDNIFVYRNYIEGVACAKAQNKPIFLQFTGWSCINDRHYRTLLFQFGEIQSYIAKHYIPIFLYVDDRTKIDEPYPIDTSNPNSRMIRTVGNIYANFQIEKFGFNHQPLFCILDTDENSLVEPVGYDTAIKEELFLEFLRSGVAAFNEK